MLRRIPRALWLVLPLAYFLYFYHLAAVGLIGPDEPRYAAIARTMAASGDWVTPRLLGQPWFEKPALLYWMEAVFFRAGFGAEMAPRLPVALLAAAFLGFFWWILRREFGPRPASFATAILGTSAAWIVSSQIGTTDLPLTVTYSAAMLLALPWVRRRDPALLPWVAAFLGLAVLAKGPVAVVLACPILLPWKGPFWRDLGRNILSFLRPRVALPFLAVTLPWYALCTWANGAAFLQDFFWKHNVERFVSSTAVGNHGQPFWFFGPVLLALLLPWTPLLPLAFRRTLYADPGRLFLLIWTALCLVFFSRSANKLPSYILPLIPAAAALLGRPRRAPSDPGGSAPRRGMAGRLRRPADCLSHRRAAAADGRGDRPFARTGAALPVDLAGPLRRRHGRLGARPPRTPFGGRADHRDRGHYRDRAVEEYRRTRSRPPGLCAHSAAATGAAAGDRVRRLGAARDGILTGLLFRAAASPVRPTPPPGLAASTCRPTSRLGPA